MLLASPPFHFSQEHPDILGTSENCMPGSLEVDATDHHCQIEAISDT